MLGLDPERALGELSIEGKVWEGQAAGRREGTLRGTPVASRSGQEGMGSPGHRRSWSAGSQDVLHRRSKLYTSLTISKRGVGKVRSELGCLYALPHQVLWLTAY